MVGNLVLLISGLNQIVITKSHDGSLWKNESQKVMAF
jgi:hypothetical protein